MLSENIHLGLINRDLQGHSMDSARDKVLRGESKWVHGRLLTLKLVPVGYELESGEQFIQEVAPGKFVPERV